MLLLTHTRDQFIEIIPVITQRFRAWYKLTHCCFLLSSYPQYKQNPQFWGGRRTQANTARRSAYSGQASHWHEFCSRNAPQYSEPSRAILVVWSLSRPIRDRTSSIKWCHFQWPWIAPNQIVSSARHYSTLNISKTVQDRDIVIWNTNRNWHNALLNGVITNDLQWPWVT